MYLTPTWLILIAIVFAPAYLSFGLDEESERGSDMVLFALREICRIISATALCAWIVVVVAPMLLWDGFDRSSVAQINATIQRLQSWLDHGWIALLLLFVLFLAAGWLIRTRYYNSGARLTGRLTKAVGWLKAVVAILASCTFVAAGANAQVSSRIEQAEQAGIELRELQLALLAEVEDELMREAIATVIDQAEEDDPDFGSFSIAYLRSVDYVRPANFEAPTIPPDPPRTPRDPGPDLGPDDLLDVTPERVTELSATMLQTDTEVSRDALVEGAFKIVSDESIVDPAKDAFIGIENPVLESLADAFLDPLLVEPLRRSVRGYAKQVLAGLIDFDAARERIRIAARSGASLLAARTRSAGRTLAPSLGEPVWDDVRGQLDRAIMEGRLNKPADIQAEARQEMLDFRQTRDDLRRLLAGAPASEGERAFARYLANKPIYAALWGYAVIALAPAQYEAALRRISIERPDSKADAIQRAMLRRTPETDAVLREIGFDPASDARLSNEQIRSRLWDVHGPYPLDGFVLYAESTGAWDTGEARAYYQTDEVREAVERYCPAG